jgi:hypothetical protein
MLNTGQSGQKTPNVFDHSLSNLVEMRIAFNLDVSLVDSGLKHGLTIEIW